MRKQEQPQLTVKELAAQAVAKGIRLDQIKASGAVCRRTKTVILNNVQYNWPDFVDSYWEALNASQRTASVVARPSFNL